MTMTAKRKKSVGWVTALLIFFLLSVATFLADRIFVPIRSGEAGILWSRFKGGTRTDRVYSEGFHVLLPWDRMYVYDTRLQERTKVCDVLSADGLSVEVEVSVRFRPVKGKLGALHKSVGPDYMDKLTVPEIGSHVRRLMAQYRPDELYAANRTEIEEAIKTSVAKESALAESRAVHIEDIVIRTIRMQ